MCLGRRAKARRPDCAALVVRTDRDTGVDVVHQRAVPNDLLPVDYHMFGRTFDGIDYRFLAPLKKNRPADYQKVLDWFPLAEMEVWRYERAQAA